VCLAVSCETRSIYVWVTSCLSASQTALPVLQAVYLVPSCLNVCFQHSVPVCVPTIYQYWTFVYLYVQMSTECQAVSLCNHLFAYQCDQLSYCVPICLHVWPAVYLFANLSNCVPKCPKHALTLCPPTFQPFINRNEVLKPMTVTTQKCYVHVKIWPESGRIVYSTQIVTLRPQKSATLPSPYLGPQYSVTLDPWVSVLLIE
jgi:hypothetical protein